MNTSEPGEKAFLKYWKLVRGRGQGGGGGRVANIIKCPQSVHEPGKEGMQLGVYFQANPQDRCSN